MGRARASPSPGGASGAANLLIVVDYFADPPVIGTAVLAYHWARALRRRGHAVDLLCAFEAWDEAWAPYYRSAGIGRPGVDVARRGRLRRALALARGAPPALARVDARRLAAAIEATGRRYDAALVIGPALLPLAERLERSYRVLFVPTDAVSLVLERRTAPWPNPVERLRWRLEAGMWRRLEARRFQRLDAVAFVAPDDARAAACRWPEARRRRLHVIPNGVDTDYFQPTAAEPAGPRPAEVVFTGNLWTYDSTVGAQWFIERVLPRVADAVPEVRLRLVGRDPAPALHAAARRDTRVAVTADVPDLRPYLAAASAYVCPLISGAGVKNRLLEALAMGKAAVATSTCAEPLGLRDGRHLLVADEPDAFADAVVRLLREPETRDRLGAAARAEVAARFSWDAAADRVEAVLASMG